MSIADRDFDNFGIANQPSFLKSGFTTESELNFNGSFQFRHTGAPSMSPKCHLLAAPAQLESQVSTAAAWLSSIHCFGTDEGQSASVAA